MEKIPNVSSEEELLKLREEGKINEGEYDQLLSAMNKSAEDSASHEIIEKTKIPLSLIIVACLFISGGIFACIEMVSTIMQGRVHISITVIGIFIGWGLFVLSRGWRICALVLLWILIICIPVISLFYLNQPSSGFYVSIFGNKLPREPILILLLNVLCLLLLLWSYWVLTRPQIKSLFGIKDR
jgi:hypothetical protein